MFDKLEPRYDQELLQYMQWIVVVDSFMIGGVVIDFVDLGLMDLDFMMLPRCYNAYNTCVLVRL